MSPPSNWCALLWMRTCSPAVCFSSRGSQTCWHSGDNPPEYTAWTTDPHLLQGLAMPDSPGTMMGVVSGDFSYLKWWLFDEYFLILKGHMQSFCKDQRCLSNLPVHIGPAQHRWDTGKFSRLTHMVTRCQRRGCHWPHSEINIINRTCILFTHQPHYHVHH